MLPSSTCSVRLHTLSGELATSLIADATVSAPVSILCQFDKKKKKKISVMFNVLKKYTINLHVVLTCLFEILYFHCFLKIAVL